MNLAMLLAPLRIPLIAVGEVKAPIFLAEPLAAHAGTPVLSAEQAEVLVDMILHIANARRITQVYALYIPSCAASACFAASTCAVARRVSTHATAQAVIWRLNICVHDTCDCVDFEADLRCSSATIV